MKVDEDSQLGSVMNIQSSLWRFGIDGERIKTLECPGQNILAQTGASGKFGLDKGRER